MQCPICKSLRVRIIHHYYDKHLHKTHKVYKCQVCGNEWNNKQQKHLYISHNKCIITKILEEVIMKDFKQQCDDMTDIIISCWDSNQECDENGKLLDGLTFDERLSKKLEELEEEDKKFMNLILEGV